MLKLRFAPSRPSSTIFHVMSCFIFSVYESITWSKRRLDVWVEASHTETSQPSVDPHLGPKPTQISISFGTKALPTSLLHRWVRQRWLGCPETPCASHSHSCCLLHWSHSGTTMLCFSLTVLLLFYLCVLAFIALLWLKIALTAWR